MGSLRRQGKDRRQEEGSFVDMSGHWGETSNLTRLRVLLALTWQVSGKDGVRAWVSPKLIPAHKSVGSHCWTNGKIMDGWVDGWMGGWVDGWKDSGLTHQKNFVKEVELN